MKSVSLNQDVSGSSMCSVHLERADDDNGYNNSHTQGFVQVHEGGEMAD